MVALLNLSSWCLVMVEQLFLAVLWGCQRLVIVVFPYQTHLFFFTIVLPEKSDSDAMFCLQSYQGLIIDISLVY